MPHFTPWYHPGQQCRANRWRVDGLQCHDENGAWLAPVFDQHLKLQKRICYDCPLQLLVEVEPTSKKNTHDTSAQNPGWNPKKYGRTMTQNKVPPWRFVHGYHNGPFRCPHGGGNMANHSNSRNTITVPVAENKLTQFGKYQQEEFYRKHKICVWGKSFELP